MHLSWSWLPWASASSCRTENPGPYLESRACNMFHYKWENMAPILIIWSPIVSKSQLWGLQDTKNYGQIWFNLKDLKLKNRMNRMIIEWSLNEICWQVAHKDGDGHGIQLLWKPASWRIGGLEDPGTQWYPSDTRCSHVPRHIMRWLPGEPYLEDQWNGSSGLTMLRNVTGWWYTPSEKIDFVSCDYSQYMENKSPHIYFHISQTTIYWDSSHHYMK